MSLESFKRMVWLPGAGPVLSKCCMAPMFYRIETDSWPCIQCKQDGEMVGVTKEQFDEACIRAYEARMKKVS